MNPSENAQLAAGYASKAAEVAGKLKPGTWEAVQALAMLSIAESLITQNAAGNDNP